MTSGFQDVAASALRPADGGGEKASKAAGLVRSRRVAIDIVGFLDMLAILIGALLPAAVVAGTTDEPLRWSVLLQFGLVTCFFAYLCMRHFGLYDVSQIHALPIRPVRVMAAIACSFTIALGLALPFGVDEVRFWVWYAAWACVSASAILLNRVIARRVLSKMAQSGSFDQRIAIYGSGPLARRLAQELSCAEDRHRFVGVFDERSASERSAQGIEVSGNLEDLIRIGRSERIDQIIIALPADADRRTADVARRLEQLPASLHVCTHIASDLVDAGSALSVSSIGAIGLLDIKRKPLADWGRHLKAVEDFVIGAIALAFALPVMALIAVAIKIDSRGPVLFRQRRHGLNRQVIEVLKFRTMSVMEDGAGVRQATRDDPRVTRVGRILRSTSLDELPQLINVLKGQMSLVGPRPHALVHDDHFGEMLERYANRHRVKPGITGLAQVEGFRGPTETADKMRDRIARDLHYIDNWSLWMDLRILGLTLLIGLRHRNAL